jgi:hypothetical protein
LPDRSLWKEGCQVEYSACWLDSPHSSLARQDLYAWEEP